MNRASAVSSGSARADAVLPRALIERLADGAAAGRLALAGGLGLSSDELDEALSGLRAAGLELVEAGDGALRLGAPIRWIDAAAIEAALDTGTRALIERLELAFELESTNRHLLDAAVPTRGLMQVAIAEYQHGGRGRHGRRWTMPPGAGLALSAAWRFERGPEALAAFSLAVGAAARRAIRDAARIDAGLKWPNDLVVDGGKLGGILVELDPLDAGACRVVAGIGINVRVPASCLAGLSDYRHGARDLAGAAGFEIDRSQLAAALISRLAELFSGYADAGFAPYRAEWRQAHVLEAEAVELVTPSGAWAGIVRGIEDDGSLLVEDEAGAVRRVVSGDVTVRARG